MRCSMKTDLRLKIETRSNMSGYAVESCGQYSQILHKQGEDRCYLELIRT
jgi:hypothetical protein